MLFFPLDSSPGNQDRARMQWYAISNYETSILVNVYLQHLLLTHLFISLADQRPEPLAGTLGNILHGLVIFRPLVVGL